MQSSNIPENKDHFDLKAFLKSQNLLLTDHISIFLSTVTIAILSLAVPIMTLQVYDRILDNPEGTTLPILLGGVIVAILLEGFIKMARKHIVQNASAIFEHKLNCRIFFQTLHSDFSKIKMYDPGKHLQRFGSINQVKDGYTGSLFVVYCETVLLPLFFLVLAYISFWLVLVPIGISVFYILFSVWIGLKLKHKIAQKDELDDDRYSYLVTVLSGIHTIKAFGTEKIFERQYEAIKEGVGTKHYEIAMLNSAISNLGNILGITMTVMIISCGAMLVIENQISTGALIATMLISGRIMQPVQKIISVIMRKMDSQHSNDDLKDLLTAPTARPVQDLYNDMDGLNDTVFEPVGKIEIKDLSFQYADDDHFIFENLNFEVSPKQAIAISSDFGEGKTTLMKLMCGIYPPTNGEILLDDHPASAYPQSQLPLHVGYVQSTSVLFYGTIRDNITRFGLTSDEQAMQIAELLNMNREIARLPEGFDTILSGKRNDGLPPDLRQKIAIARALAPRPKLLLFDDATYNLGYDSYNAVFQAMAKLKGLTTMILVTNDKNLNSICDRFYKIDNQNLTPLNKP